MVFSCQDPAIWDETKSEDDVLEMKKIDWIVIVDDS